MGVRWTFLLVLALAAVLVRPQLEYNITTTWNGEEIDHEPIRVVLSGSPDGEYLEMSIEAPFFNDPPAPPGPPAQPFFGLWDYEVVEAFFLNDDNQYVEVEVCPWGQHIVLLLNGQRVTIRHSLPLEVNTSISQSEGTWTGVARIPVGYLPKNTTKFNAYGIHGSGDNRTYESLYPASENATNPDFHALHYFSDIDLSDILPEHGSAEMSELWTDSIDGIFRYRIETTWNSVSVDHQPVEITLQGYTGGVEMNVTAPFFNDSAPDGTPGQPFYGLWDYEVVEMFFLNEKNEYLEVELGPWGEHLLLMLKGARNVLKHSLPLDFIVVERTEPSEGNPGIWKGSAMLPPDFFPPKVNRMNAYAIHGTGDDRQYESLYPAPNNDPDFLVPDFHRIELFQPIDFEYQVSNNSDYSQLWKDAIASSSSTISPVGETTEEMEAVTVLGPANSEGQLTSSPVQPSLFQSTQEKIVDAKVDEALSRIPKPEQISVDELRHQSLNRIPPVKPVKVTPEVPQPQPIRIGNREIDDPRQGNLRGNPVQGNLQRTPAQRPPFRQPQRATSEFHTRGQQSQFEDERVTLENTQIQNQQPSIQNQEHFEVPSRFSEVKPQRTSQFSNEGQVPIQSQDQSHASSQLQPQGDTFGTSPLQSEGQRVFQLQTQEESQQQFVGPQFINQNTRPQQTSQNQDQQTFQNQDQQTFQNQGQQTFPNRGQQTFQNQGQQRFPNRGQQTFQNRGQQTFQNQGQQTLQNQGQQIFQNQAQQTFQNQDQQAFQNPSLPPFQTQRPVVSQGQGPPRFQTESLPSNQDKNPENLFVDVPGSEFTNVGLQETITPEVEQAVLTLSEGFPALPPPHPVCFELGLVPDPDRCYVFHECVLEDGQWEMYSWRCGRGQKFDPINVACVRGRCQRSQARRRIRRP